MSDQKRFLDKDYTRRQFLKLSGKSLVGVAMSSAMLSTLGVTAGALAEDQVRVWAFPQGLLVVNADRCVGCQRCEINCTLTNPQPVLQPQWQWSVHRKQLDLLPRHLPSMRRPRLR